MITTSEKLISPPIAFVHASTWSLVVFLAICGIIISALILAIGSAFDNKEKSISAMVRWSLGLGIYALAIGFLVGSDLLSRAFIPWGPLFFVGTVGLAMSIGWIKIGHRISQATSIKLLVGFQAFRLPLEIVLHDWYSTGTIPITMTWEGSNWDIISGIIALATMGWVEKHRWLAWFANGIGIVLLINVARVAILSSPVPFGWPVDPPLELILHLPYAYIVPICVGGAALGHVLLTRKLLLSRARTTHGMQER